MLLEAGKNAELVRRGYAAFNAGDLKTLTGLFHEAAVWHLPGRSPHAGVHQGRDAVLAYFGRLGAETGGTFRANLEQLVEAEDGRVIGLQRDTATRDGRKLAVDACLVFTLKGGRIVGCREYFHDLYAWDAFWA